MSNELESDSRAQAIMMAMNLGSLGAMVLVATRIAVQSRCHQLAVAAVARDGH
jgi:hypothetical protein